MAFRQQLPGRPNLEQLRKRAKDLLKLARAGDLAAIQRFEAQLAERRAPVRLSGALAVVAREYGFLSWANLKTYVQDQASAELAQVAVPDNPPSSHRPRPRGPRQMPSLKYVQDLRAAVVEAARQGELFPFIFGPPIGPLRKAVQAPLREALVASGDLRLVVDVLLLGAQHSNPRVRSACAHAMDWLAGGDERCLPTLLGLVNDPVPRVRVIAIHSLVCDDCKVTPLPNCPEVAPLILSKTTSDPSARVRRNAQLALRLLSTAQDLTVANPNAS